MAADEKGMRGKWQRSGGKKAGKGDGSAEEEREEAKERENTQRGGGRWKRRGEEGR